MQIWERDKEFRMMIGLYDRVNVFFFFERDQVNVLHGWISGCYLPKHMHAWHQNGTSNINTLCDYSMQLEVYFLYVIVAHIHVKVADTKSQETRLAMV